MFYDLVIEVAIVRPGPSTHIYASYWMKCHHPAKFLAAMLNSQLVGY